MCVWAAGSHATSHCGPVGGIEKGNSLYSESQSPQMGLLARTCFPAARSPAEVMVLCVERDTWPGWGLWLSAQCLNTSCLPWSVRKTCLTHRDTSKGTNLISAWHTLFQGRQLRRQTCCPGPNALPTGLKADPESVHLRNNVVPKSTTTLYLIQTHHSDWMFKDTWHSPNTRTKYLKHKCTHMQTEPEQYRDKRVATQMHIHKYKHTNA